jgi:hypothetical protein
MNKNKKVFSVLVVICIIVLLGVISFAGYYIYSSNMDQDNAQTTNILPLEAEYNNLKSQYSLKYETFQSAFNAFKNATNSNMGIERISFYVPGKLPHEDGNPYFIGRGTLSKNSNECIVGYMNLVTGVTESHDDVCVIVD